jgi:hypothetical protein
MSIAVRNLPPYGCFLEHFLKFSKLISSPENPISRSSKTQHKNNFLNLATSK